MNVLGTSSSAARITLAALALCGVLLARSAAAECTGVLALSEPPGPGEGLVGMTAQLRTTLSSRDASQLTGEEIRARMVGSAAPATLSELDRAYAGALTRHAAGEYEESVRTLRVIVADLERLVEGPEVFEQWTRAMLRLARVEQELGRAMDAQADLERVVRSQPETKADPRQFPPSFLALLEDARQRLAAAGTHRLTVESRPEARVFVDGREVGMSPITVEVAPGSHRVGGQRGSVHAATLVSDIRGDRVVQLDMSLAEALRPDAGPGLATPPVGSAARIIAAASRLAFDRLVAVSLSRRGDVTYLVAALYDVRRGAMEREGHLRLADGAPPRGGMDALAAFLLTGEPSGLISTLPGALTPSHEVATATPRAARGDVTVHRHLAFYLRPSLDLGFMSSSAGGRTISGAGIALDVSLGGAVVENVILAGHVWSGGIFSSAGNKQVLVNMGPEITWYSMPLNIYVSATPAIAQLSLYSRGTEISETDFGFGANLAAGREWWVSDHWGLGVAVQGVFARTPEKAPSTAQWTTWGATLAMSATYN